MFAALAGVTDWKERHAVMRRVAERRAPGVRCVPVDDDYGPCGGCCHPGHSGGAEFRSCRPCGPACVVAAAAQVVRAVVLPDAPSRLIPTRPDTEPGPDHAAAVETTLAAYERNCHR